MFVRGDVVVNAWAYSTHNGAFAFDEALHKWLGCVVLTTGTGNVTSSRRQIELAHQYQATAILTTGGLSVATWPRLPARWVSIPRKIST